VLDSYDVASVIGRIACSVYTRRSSRQSPRVYTTGYRHHDDRSDSRGDDRPVYTPYDNPVLLEEPSVYLIPGV